MPPKEKKTKNIKKEESDDERTPKHVVVRLSYRDYEKLVEYADIAAKIKEEKELKNIIASVINETGRDVTPEKFLGFIATLPTKERTLKRFYSQPPRAKPVRMYFTDPEHASDAVKKLHAATKKWTKGKLRYDQKKETCPTDVRVMFYAYLRGKDLVKKDDLDITIDKSLKEWAPKILSGVKKVPRRDGSFVWKICSEIRGIKSKKSPIKGSDNETNSSSDEQSEEESEEEPVSRRSRRKNVVSDSSSEYSSQSEEESEEEIQAKSDRKSTNKKVIKKSTGKNKK